MKVETRYSWSQRIEWCERAGIKPKQICEEIDMAPSSLSEIKSGKTKNPTGYPAVKLFLLSESCRPKNRAKKSAQ